MNPEGEKELLTRLASIDSAVSLLAAIAGIAGALWVARWAYHATEYLAAGGGLWTVAPIVIAFAVFFLILTIAQRTAERIARRISN